MSYDYLSEIADTYKISLTDVAVLIDNFRRYVKETQMTDVLEFLSLRKTKYKDEIKKTHLKKKLSVGIEKYMKSPLKILKKIFSEEKIFNEFILSTNDIVKEKNRAQKEIDYNMSYFWTNEEIAKLKSNFENIIQKYNIKNYKDLFLNNTKEIKKLKKDIKFRNKLAEGFPHRSSRIVYLKMKLLIENDISDHRKWTHSEVEQLELLVKQFKPNWKLIGKELNRVPKECRDKYYNIHTPEGYTRNLGPWTKKESKRLRKAVRTLMNVPKYTFVTENIPWVKVSQYVKTRSSKDCRKHWTITFACIKQDGVRSRFNDDIFLRFVKKIKKAKYEFWRLIDWKYLWREYDKGQFTPSPSALNLVIRSYFKKIASVNPTYGTEVKKLIKQLKLESGRKNKDSEDSK